MIDFIFQSFWTFSGSLILLAATGHYLICIPAECLIKIEAIRSLEKLKAGREIAVMGGLEYKDKEQNAKEDS